MVEGSEKPYWVVKGKSYVVSATGGNASTDEFTDIIFVDGKKMTGAEVNATVKRSTILAVGGAEKEAAKEKYGIKKPILEIYINTKPPAFFNTPKPGKKSKKN